MSDIKELIIFPPRNTIFLRGVRKSGLVDNVMIIVEGTKRGLDKFDSIIGTKNLWCIGILSDNFQDKKGECSDNLRVIANKIEPTRTSIVINKHDIVAMTQNGGVQEGPQTSQCKRSKGAEEGISS